MTRQNKSKPKVYKPTYVYSSLIALHGGWCIAMHSYVVPLDWPIQLLISTPHRSYGVELKMGGEKERERESMTHLMRLNTCHTVQETRELISIRPLRHNRSLSSNRTIRRQINDVVIRFSTRVKRPLTEG